MPKEETFLHIRQATYLREYKLRLEFSNEVVKDVDLAEELSGEAFEPLRAPEVFAAVRVSEETGTIEWPNGGDFAPEFLYEIGKEAKQAA